jgi:hypothetical protein
MRSILVGLALVLSSCNADPSSAAGALGGPKTKLGDKPVFDHKAPLEAKGAQTKGEIRSDIKGLEKIVAPDMLQSPHKIVAPDMVQKIVAPDMVQKIVAPDMVQKPGGITPPGPGPKPLTPAPEPSVKTPPPFP